MAPRVLLVGVLATCSLASAASETEPHYHTGKLTPYEIAPPSVLLSTQDEEKLRSGKAVMQTQQGSDDSRRMVMVQNIAAPANIVLGRIVDFENYDRMVSTVDSCTNYVCNTEGETQTIKSTYEISAMRMKMKYFMEHTYDPVARCVTFHLDYDRRSDLDDSVGYWYVQPTGSASCRVYYSCECKLRGWVPPPVYSVLTREALKTGTTWLNDEAVKEWRETQRQMGGPGQGLVRFVADVRERLPRIELPPSPAARLVSSWRRSNAPMRDAADAATQFVSRSIPRPLRSVISPNLRSPKASS